MSLFKLDSSFERLTIADSESTTQSYSKKRSLVWQYCRCPTANEDQDLLFCARCPPDLLPKDYKGPYSSKYSENIKKHLLRAHTITVKKALSQNQVVVNQQLKQLYYQAEATRATDKLDTQILKAQLNQAVITEALISLIVVQNLSFCLAEWPKFHTLCQVLNRECEGIITTSHSGVYNKVSKAWSKHKDVVR
jgi:hypothetical protein